MFHHALKQLVKDVWRNRQKSVSQWEPFPEWVIDGLETGLTASRVKCANIAIGQEISIDCRSLHTRWKDFVFAKLIMQNLTFRTAATVCAGCEHLFRVVPNKIGKDRMTSLPDTVATHHGDSSFAIVADRIQYKGHACMEYIHKSTAPRSFVTYAREFGDRDVSN